MPRRWSVAIFSSRENADTLRRTIEAVAAASVVHPTTIDVLVDGNAESAAALAAGGFASLGPMTTVRLWLVAWKDKATTWNHYVHELAPPSDCVFFVDGYARPAPDSFMHLQRAFDDCDTAWVAGAVPTVGRTATRMRAEMLAEGGLHGNLYALPDMVVAEFRARGFRLPRGLYRNDSLIGAVAAFAGSPSTEKWDPMRRIAVVPKATWAIDAPAFEFLYLRRHWKRRLRQAQGALELAAIRHHLAVLRERPEKLPRTVNELLSNPRGLEQPVGWFERLLRRQAASRIAGERDWSDADEPPRLVRTWRGDDSACAP